MKKTSATVLTALTIAFSGQVHAGVIGAGIGATGNAPGGIAVMIAGGLFIMAGLAVNNQMVIIAGTVLDHESNQAPAFNLDEKLADAVKSGKVSAEQAKSFTDEVQARSQEGAIDFASLSSSSQELIANLLK